MSEELDNTIRENADGPKSATVDGQSVSQHSLRDQIEADRYLQSKKAMKGKGLGGIKRVRTSPPGTV